MSDEQEIMKVLNLDYNRGFIADAHNKWYVYIFENVKKPSLIGWKGKPIIYRIGYGKASTINN
jgi:hypothetical protein